VRKTVPITLAWFWALTAACSQGTHADEPPITQSSSSSTTAPGFSKLVTDVTNTVLEHHIDPPTRQQMVLDGLKAVYQAAGVPVPSGLSRRVSAQATPEQLATLLADVWPKPSANGVSGKELEGKFLDGLLMSIPGEAELISAKDRKVAEQIAGNRYVGIHIALRTDDTDDRPHIAEVRTGGPADKAGVKPEDIIERIEGADTKGMPLREAVDRLRGDEGTDVTITVRQPKEQKSRTIRITRGQLAQETVRGIRKSSTGEWKTRLDEPGAVGFIRIGDLSASTPHELRKLARQMESEGVAAIVIDFRGLGGNSTHPAVLLADCLLESGTIGRVRTAQGEQSYQAQPDAVFRGWPMAVLIDQTTWGTAEWLAAALQDNRRAILVGRPTRAALAAMPVGNDGTAPDRLTRAAREAAPTVVRSTVPVGDGTWSVALVTGSLERGDGQPLGGAALSPMSAISSGRVLRQGSRGSVPSPKTGVRPDQSAGGPQARGGSMVGRADDFDVAADVILQKAVQLLRERPNKT
jgi:carboxyl-terminal processing protease